MALTDIISEEEIRAPNMEVAQGGPEDFMTEDEMDPDQDPELQQLLDSLPGEQAQVLMQLIKEFKAMVAQGFQGEFEDFVKMKMSTAQGGPEDFMSEEEMIVPDEELQSMVPMGQQVAQGGRIGYDQGGGIMDVVEEEQVETGPTPQQLIMAWLEARGLPATPENIQKAILEMSREGQGPAMPREQSPMPQMEAPRPPTGEGYVPEELIGQDISEVVTPDVASMRIAEEVVPEDDVYSDQEMRDMKQDYIDKGGNLDEDKWFGPKEEVKETGIMQTTDPIFYSDDKITYTEEDAIQWRQQLDRLRETRRGQDPAGYLQLEDRKMKEGVDKGFISEEDYLNKWQMPFFGRRGEQKTEEIDRYQELTEPRAQGGRAGYAYGNEVTADAPGVMSQVSPSQKTLIEGNQIAEDAYNEIFQKFSEKFPGLATGEETMAEMIALLQAEGVMDYTGDEMGILGLDRSMDMITPESAERSARRISMGDTRYGDVPYAQGGRARYGLGSLVKSVFKGVKGLAKSVKKFAKSDLGKMALGYLATAGLGNIGAAGGFGKASWASPFTKGAGTGWLRPGTVMGNLGKSYGNLFSKSPEIAKASKTVTDPVGPGKYMKEFTNPVKDVFTKSGGDGFLAGLGQSFKKNPFPWIVGTSGLAGAYTAANPGDNNLENLMGNYKGEVSDWDKIFADIRSGKNSTAFSTANTDFPYPDYMNLAAEGGRIGRAEGGLMNLGGLEKDYRAEGGFVPIGKKEKADDVPARLSVNEFVFTADAVRNAGGGDVDRGAEVMENVMTNLEQGGSISKESQGLEGAREMFEVSERLSEVV